MFTNDQASCDHNKITIVVEQEEIQQYNVELTDSSINKVYDDINLTEPIMVSCNICQFELKYEDIVFEKFIPSPLLDSEQINILTYITKRKSDDTDGDECVHDKVSLELYQLVQIVLEKSDDSYKISELNYGEKEIYLTCDLCSTILYEYFDAELENFNGTDELDDYDDFDDADDSDIIILDDEDEDEDEDEEESDFEQQ